MKWLTKFLVLDAMGHGETFKHVQGFFFQVQRPDDASSSTSSDVQVVILI